MASRRKTKIRDPLAAFHPAVGAWFRASLGEPTRVQVEAWPPIARGESTLLFAPTGSGKTLAAFLWAIDRLVCPSDTIRQTPTRPARQIESGLRVLYISPLKALAVDVERNLRAPLAGISEAASRAHLPLHNVSVAVRTGDTKAAERAKMRRAPPDVLITTPESLYLLLTSSQRELLTTVETVIVDEIHQMVATKRGAHLFLSLERLEALRGGRPLLQRIGLSATQKPLDEVARLLGGFEVNGRRVSPRPVTIVHASSKKTLSITVEVPPPLPEQEVESGSRSVWPKIHARLVDRIRGARSTMIFVNSRRLAERLAASLNDLAGGEIALAHHGSVAKDKRRDIEERLKAGTLPAIVATSSLELGIDMGSVDQVIQVEAPPSVASGIQRIGRASHHVGGVPTGVLVPKHAQDLLACAAAAQGIEDGDVEETFYLRNPLDVLAQQIVAIASIGIETDVEALWDLVRGAAPFAELGRESFEGVLDMLAGRYPPDEHLRPRVTWDRKRGVIRSRHGALHLAILNGGTIPDRGLYGVFLAGEDAASKSSRRVGELDEEMVFELREGEIFLLGASSWRTERITRDQVIVTPAAGMPGKMPFWHGDRAGRSFAFGTRIGKLTRDIASLAPNDARAMLERTHRLDAHSAASLVDHVRAELKASGAVPTDRHIVVERIPDELGDARICVLSPFGHRVHAPWAMAALAKLREARVGDIDVVYTDDGLVFRVPAGTSPPSIEMLFPSPGEITDIVTRELGRTSLFAARFREAAARALLLPRRSFGKRTPLWAQRKRSADLLSVASEYPSFPILLETYRECLKDAFDMPALTEILRGVASKKIRVVFVDRPFPSPFASSLLFSFVGNFIYDADAPAAERRAHALTIDHGQLKELLGEAEIRKLLDPDVVSEHERKLLDPPLRHADALADRLLRFGDLSRNQIVARAENPRDATNWLSLLLNEGRALAVRIANEERFIAVEDAGRYRDALGVAVARGVPDAFMAPVDHALASLVLRHAKTHGPFTASDLMMRWGLGDEVIGVVLESLVASGKIIQGTFRSNRDRGVVEYCDAEVLRALKKKTLAKLRQAIVPASASAFARFLAAWQNVTPPDAARVPGGASDLLQAIMQLEGCPLPASVLETEILPARVPGYRPHHLDELLSSGEVVWAGIEPVGKNDGLVALYLADREPLLARTPRESDACPPLHDKLRELLTRRGALFFGEIARALGAFPADVLSALWDLVWAGEVRTDTLEPLRSLGTKEERRNPRRARRRAMARLVPRGAEGRWSLRRWEISPSPTERFTATARTLLDRYGVVLREAAHAEGIAGGFASLYEIYRAMEDQGRVRRGYFVAGRGALQFALPGASERLRELSGEERDGERLLVLSATDPANPYGALFPWPATEASARAQRTPGARVVFSDGTLVLWLARGGHHLATFTSPDVVADALVATARAGGRAIFLTSIDGVPAPESPLASALISRGFRKRLGMLVRFSGSAYPSTEHEP